MKTATAHQMDERLFQDPHAIYPMLRAEGPAHEVIMPLGMRAWIVTRYDEVKALLTDPSVSNDCAATELTATFPDTTAGGNPVSAKLVQHMLNTDPPRHTRLRSLCANALTPHAVSRWRPRIEQITDELLDRMAGHEEIDFLDAFAYPLPLTVIGELMGLPADERQPIKDWCIGIVSNDPGQQLPAAIAMADYLTRIFREKRKNPTDDLLSALAHSDGDGDGEPPTEEEVISMAFVLLLGGHEAPAHAIANGMYALLRNPDQMALLAAHPEMAADAFEELLRFDGPVHMAILRRTTRPVRAGSVEIPAGEYLFLSLLSANRDGARFEYPNRLDILRPYRSHLAFGHGIHHCVGTPLGRIEGQVAFNRLFTRFPDMSLAALPNELHWRDSALLRGLDTLWVRLGEERKAARQTR
jgi:cytochrome P450